MKRRLLPAATALVSYLWLCLCWFDHDLDIGPLAVSAFVPLSFFAVSISTLAWRTRASLGLDRDISIALLLFAASFAARFPFVAYAYGLFSSDAAAQGVMALHIGEGRHHPIFLYNWSYVGSLKAHMTALFAALTGEPVVSFALTAVVIYAAFTSALYVLARSVSGRAESVLAAVYVVLAPGFLTAWGMGNEGNYLDVMLFGTLMLALAARMLRSQDANLHVAFWVGVLGGLAFWTHILATYYLIICSAALFVHRAGRIRLARLALFAGGFAVGDFPGLLWNASNDWLSFRWWALDAATVETGARAMRFVQQLVEVFKTSFSVLSGFWPAQDPPWPGGMWRIVLSLLIPVVVGVFAYRHRKALARPSPEAMLLAFTTVVVGVFAVSSFGWMTDEPRYLLFLFSVVPIFLASGLVALWRKTRPLAGVSFLLLIGLNVRGDLMYLREARASDPVNREFVREVEALGVRYIHSDYHLSYKYVFLSHGRMVWTSALGPAQTEWYTPFRSEVADAGSFALVPRSFRFARRIGRRLDALGVTYRRVDLLYPVLYDFSEPVRLEQLR